MHLSKIHIKGFRNLPEVTVTLNKGLTLIVGENNTGKTAIIDAVRIALGPASQGVGSRIWAKKDDLNRALGSNSFEVHLTYAEPSERDKPLFLECMSQDCSEVQIHYRWTWNPLTERYSEQRWGGSQEDETAVPSELLQALPFVYLEPLRDALANLQAGKSSRIGALIRRVERRETVSEGGMRGSERIARILHDANVALEEDRLVTNVLNVIKGNLGKIEKDLCQDVTLGATEQRFDSIVNGLALKLVSEAARYDIAENGLGYNNLLYIATVLTDLENCVDGDVPVLCIEEPEAHLHPQLQVLLADFLRDISASHPLQVIVTTHSPNIASHAGIDSIVVLPSMAMPDGRRTAVAFRDCGLSDAEKRSLDRFMDVTRASLLFARHVVLVEGICEQYLIPALTKQAGGLLEGRGISVVPVHGVGFGVFRKLFGLNRLPGKCAIITDTDPGVIKEDQEGQALSALLPGLRQDYHMKYPKLGALVMTSQANNDLEPGEPADVTPRVDAAPKPQSKEFKALVTLEFDIALPPGNANTIARVWHDSGIPGVPDLSVENLDQLQGDVQRATLVWQSVCMANGGKYKARLAQELAARIAAGEEPSFHMPDYIREALEFVGAIMVPPPTKEVEVSIPTGAEELDQPRVQS